MYVCVCVCVIAFCSSIYKCCNYLISKYTLFLFLLTLNCLHFYTLMKLFKYNNNKLLYHKKERKGRRIETLNWLLWVPFVQFELIEAKKAQVNSFSSFIPINLKCNNILFIFEIQAWWVGLRVMELSKRTLLPKLFLSLSLSRSR